MLAQPMGEMRHFLVAPHPGGKARKGVLLIQRRRMVAQAQVAHMTVDTRGVGPIRLDRHDGEAMVRYEALRDRGAGVVEL